MSSEVARKESAVRLEGVSKCYPIYDRPGDKLLELLTLRRLRRRREFWSLRDLDLEVASGQTLGIIGQNGSGKSTLLQLVAGILNPTCGRVSVRGRVSALLELGAGFDPEFTGHENVLLNAAVLGLSKSEIESRLEEILEFAGIGGFIGQPVKTYSSGMFMRLAFSVAIHVDPDVLLVDEALAVGDLIFQHRCINRIRRLRAEGKTILLVTHDLAAVVNFCDRAILLDQGRKLEEGAPEPVVQRYQALMAEREKGPLGRDADLIEAGPEPSLTRVTAIPHIHNRYGEGNARLLGICLFSADGEAAHSLRAGEEARLVISASFEKRINSPIIGFTIRDRLGVEVTSSNTAYEGIRLPAASPGDVYTVGFRVRIPQIRPGSYSISPAVAQGGIWEHTIEDWIDNAFIFDLLDTGLVYGMMRWPVEVSYRVEERAGQTPGLLDVH